MSASKKVTRKANYRIIQNGSTFKFKSIYKLDNIYNWIYTYIMKKQSESMQIWTHPMVTPNK